MSLTTESESDAPAKPARAPVKKAPAKRAPAKPAGKGDNRTVTKLVDNPHTAGSKRHGWFAKIKNGMTVEQATAAGIRKTYLHRMVGRKILKLS